MASDWVIYTDQSDEQGLLTALILTPTTVRHPSEMCYYDTFEEMDEAVKTHYGHHARHVGRTTFVVEMAKLGIKFRD